MKRERAIWSLIAVLLLVVAIVQTVRLETSNEEALRFREATAWPARSAYAATDTVEAQPFKASTQTTIPQDFWGEFAEDVLGCGGENSMLIAGNKITEGDDVTSIARVNWKQLRRIDVAGVDKNFIDVTFRMEMSQDRAEISFVYPNRKRVVQRCSMRAHPPPEPKKSVIEGYEDAAPDSKYDANMIADANMALDAQSD